MTGLAMSERKSVLSETEAARVEAEFLAELEAEHVSRQEAQVRREGRSRDKLKARERERQVLAEEELKEKLRAEFHREKGYKLYTDSAGREHWLTPRSSTGGCVSAQGTTRTVGVSRALTRPSSE